MQETRLGICGIGVEMQRIIVGMWGIQKKKKMIWGIGVAMQGIRLEIRKNWGKNKGV